MSLSAVLALGACGGSGAPPARPGAPEFRSAAALSAALIAPSDLPSGYTKSASSSALGDGLGSADPRCAQQIASLEAVRKGDATASVSYDGGDAQSLVEYLGSFRTAAPAAAALTALRAAVAGCRSFTVPGELSGTVPVDVSALSVPAMGDEVVAFQGKASTGGLSVVLDVIAVRWGWTLEVVAEGGLTADKGVLQRAAEAGLAHLDASVARS